MGTYYAIVTCRNSEDNIETALFSLKEQTIKPEYVIVVDDGSSDETPKILERIQVGWHELHIITNPDLGYNIARVVSNWNRAITYARENELKETDYHMIGTDDTVYEKEYAEKLICHMDSDRMIAISSGTYDNVRAKTPHGAGRFVRNSFFAHRHGFYPEKMGYESLVLYTAMQCNYTYKVFPNARFDHIRELGKNHHFYEFGASMRTLGYHPLFVLGKWIQYFISGKPIGRKGAVYMLYHYLSYRPKKSGYDSMYDDDIRQYIRRVQIQRIKEVTRI